jgi:ABC-type transport system involved in cytochrome bd biosynthesis fused ATPase/permease subunit
MRRSRPPQLTLARALVSASAANATTLALFVGAPYLLLESASTSRVVTAGTLAALLIGIEMLAFARSPLRYADRLGSHELGLRAVSQWRRWLLVTVGAWPFRRWRDAAAGDLLERALTDTDVLQDLWLRLAIPVASTISALVIGDLLVFVLPAGPVHRTAAVLALLATLACAIAATAAFLGPVTSIERTVRAARATRTATLVEVQAAASEVSLLGQSSFLQTRLDRLTEAVLATERRRDHVVRALRVTSVLVPIVGVVIVSRLANGHAALFGRSDLVVLLLACAAVDVATTVRSAVEVGAQVTAATERLDALASDAIVRSTPWPPDDTLACHALTVIVNGRKIVTDLSREFASGRRVAITGPIGSGKSTVLRVLAGLDSPDSGTVTVGDVAIGALSDVDIRRRLGYVSADPRLTSGVAARVLRAGRQVDIDVATSMTDVGMVATDSTRWVHLSRGETMRVALVRQLASVPSILVLDEPTSGLGPEERRLVLARLRRYSGTLICATHDPDVIATCDEVVALGELTSPVGTDL